MVLGGLLFGTNYIKMDKRHGFYMVGAAELLSFSLMLFDLGGAIYTALFLVAWLVTVPLLLRSIHLYLNYGVYVELSQQEGFPSFVRSTSDELLPIADKVYSQGLDGLKDTESFNTQLYVPAKPMPKKTLGEMPLVVNFTDGEEASSESDTDKNNEEYKYGVTLFGFEFIFPHDDVGESSIKDKKYFMQCWNEAASKLEKGFGKMLLLAGFPAVVAMMSGMWNGNIKAVYAAPVLLYNIFVCRQSQGGKGLGRCVLCAFAFVGLCAF